MGGTSPGGKDQPIAPMICRASVARLQDTEDLDLTDFDVVNLSLRYEVSEHAMTLRLVNLGMIDSS